MISSEQVRAARALLRLEQEELAERAHISVATVRRLEAVNGAQKVSPNAINEVERALTASGADFIDQGVRRRCPPVRRDAEVIYRNLRAIAERSAALQSSRPLFTEADLYDESGLPA